MTSHVFDDLPQLLTGDADRLTVTAVTAHLRDCADCRDELVDALAAHAALMSAGRFAPGVVSPITLDSASAVEADAAPPDLAAVFAQIRAEVDEPMKEASTAAPLRARRGAGSSPPRRAWLAAAAAAVILVGGGGAYLAAQGDPAQTSRALSLAAFGDGTSSASAKLIGKDQMKLDASALPQLAAGSYYEIWLTNSARTSMAPVGVLDADRKAQISVPASEMASYAAIEVSVQQTAGVGSYSGHSVLRGSYA